MITIEQGMKVSAIIDKMKITMPVTKGKGQQELGAELMFQVVSKLHKAKDEVYAFVAEVKGCTKEEAKNVDLIEFIKELIGAEGMKDFLSSAVTSQAQE